jgi:biotin operon repressor
MTVAYMDVYSAIRGLGSRDTPVPLDHVARRCGLSERVTKSVVQELRRNGHQIVSSRGKANGYYYADTPTESDAYAKKLYSEAVSRLRTLKGMTNSAAARELLGQLKMEMFT